MQKLKDILNLPVRGGVKTIKKVLDRYIISKEEKKDIAEEIVNLEANLAPKYPRCFIWYDLGNDGDVGEYFPPYNFFSELGSLEFAEGVIQIGVNTIVFFTKYYNDSGIKTLDSFLNRHKEKYKEISLKEFMGECPEGDFGIITISQYFKSNEVYTLLDDEFSKRRINYLKNNIQNKYNIIRIAVAEDSYYLVHSASCTLDKENNCIIFEINQLPPLDMATQIKVSLDAEVINNENNL